MITVPNTYLGISANKLSCIATELEQKNTTLTAENVRLQKELEAEHVLAESLGLDCERLKDENDKLRELVRDIWHDIPKTESCEWNTSSNTCDGADECNGECAFWHRMAELGIKEEQ